MNIKIICLGKIKEQSLASLIDEYKKRISKYANLEIIELSDEAIPSNPSEKEILNIKKLEANKIKSKLNSSDFVICLDQYGKTLTSEEFAEKIQDITLKGFSSIAFIIGGTTGLDRELVANSNFTLSFSKLTFPHQLIRLFLTEQIFRAFKIQNNERYHW
ncbi:MAG: 23S rRNA (pseudouridine(1915)-N(3))-methyltransferase RlmH [Clostridia bacterium]|nr:23S rRNA (pseudouridine(1915)-N(3))-methyltransferase RlmH [Clostridia bacterium]